MAKSERLVALSLFLLSLTTEQGFCSVNSQVSWVEHLRQCKDAKCLEPTIMSLGECKGACVKKTSCQMIKYHSERERCFLCENKVMKSSRNCTVKFDFFVQTIPHVEWTEYLGICRSPSTYKTVSAKTAEQCKNACAKEERCAMVKYYAKKKKCWLCPISQMRPSNTCRDNYDFYVKAIPVPHYEWTEFLGICRSPSSYKTVFAETALECKNSCAREQRCAMIKYLDKKKKCWLCHTTEMRPSTNCKYKYDFYIKVSSMPDVEWDEHHGMCKSSSPYTELSKRNARECKNACAREQRCLMVRYYASKKKCSLLKSTQLQPSRDCRANFEFYEKVLPVPNVKFEEHLGLCKFAVVYVVWKEDTATQCKNRCARDKKCRMASYYREKKKCWLSESSNMHKSKGCPALHDYYVKVLTIPPVKWIEKLGLCRRPTSYATSSVKSATECKKACAQDPSCAMVKYLAKKKRCWLCESLYLKYSDNCKDEYDFYQKDSCASAKRPCRKGLLCLNKGYEHDCVAKCGRGFYEDGNTCKDLDECSQNAELCVRYSKCVNTIGSYKCICDTGFYSVENTCRDIDECFKTPHLCGLHGNCINNLGSYKCDCDSGYEVRDKSCQDINECTEFNNTCSPNALCQNTNGSYTCNCITGFSGDGKTCEDVDECSQSSYLCKPYSKCVNTLGSYDCVCRDGYTGDGFICNDIDECRKRMHTCDHYCINTVGGYNCSCRLGYVYNGSDCIDVNECANAQALCGHARICINMPGSYRCNCERGFTPLKERCVDFNECKEWSDTCGDGKCINTQGSYNCLCRKGFAFDQGTCKSIEAREVRKSSTIIQLPGKIGTTEKQLLVGTTASSSVSATKHPTKRHYKSGKVSTVKLTVIPTKKPRLRPRKHLTEILLEQPVLPHTHQPNLKTYNQSLVRDSNTLAPSNTTLTQSNTTLTQSNTTLMQSNTTLMQSNTTLMQSNTTLMQSNTTLMQSNTTLTQSNATLPRLPDSFIPKDLIVSSFNRSQIIIPREYIIESSEESIIEQRTKTDEWIFKRANTTARPGEWTGGATTEEWSSTTTEFPAIAPLSAISKMEWIAHRNLCLSVSFYKVIKKVPSASGCIRSCERHKKCVMVKYHKTEKRCWLNNNRKILRMSKCEKRFNFYIKAINECRGVKTCHRHAVCQRSKGHRLCKCVYGFTGDGWDCKDIDECSIYNGVCGPNAHCVNTIGKFSCRCKRGFIKDGRNCKSRKQSLHGAKDRIHTLTKLRDLIGVWKKQHNGATSYSAVAIYIVSIIAFLVQVIY